MRKSKTVDKVPFLAPDVETKIIPSPTDGWDAISPLAEMDPKRAPILQNWVPRPGYVEVREGYFPWNKPTTVPVETLMIYRSPTGETLFAVSGANIYDVSNTSVSAVQTLPEGLGSARMQYTNFTPSGAATVLQCCNGVDLLLQWNGIVWSNPAVTDLPSGFSSTASIINIYAAKQRLWYVFKNSTIVGFLDTATVSGSLNSGGGGTQDFGPLFTKGGYLVAVADWTIDGGNGPQDYVAFISSRGQIALYGGTDPTNASAWTLVGVFNLAPPMGYRCAYSIGSDVALITQQGVLPISQALPFDPSADRSVAITARIQNAMAQAAMIGADLFGWQLMTFPLQQLLILNVPISENETQVQFVMNTLTGAWCKFTGWNANCFEIFNNNLYWGDNNGYVNQGYSGLADGQLPVNIDMQCAFNWFDEPGKEKRMTMIQPLLTTEGNISPTLGVDTDFGTSTATNLLTITQSGALWDVAIWDSSLWPTGATIYAKWLTVLAVGHCFAARINTSLPVTGVGTSLFDTALFDIATFDGATNGTAITLQVNAFNSILETGGAI
jgi:hypothetical protein